MRTIEDTVEIKNIESLSALKEAIERNRSIAFVYERFQDYFFWYESLEMRGVKEKLEFKEAESEYLKYLVKFGKEKADE